MPEYTLIVFGSDAEKRLDVFLMDYTQTRRLGLSRTQIQRLIVAGGITISGVPVTKPHHKIKPGERITIVIPEKKEHLLETEDIPLTVVYEDEDLAVIDKPPGLVVHPAPGNAAHTLVNALLFRFGTVSSIAPGRPGIVHRLDKDTSGLLVIAKNNFAHLKLAEQFARHSIRRRYVALVKGSVEFDEHTIEMPIGRHPFRRKNMSVGFGEHTKYAKTYYKTLRRTQALSLLQLEPFTGRTHQLRVHLAFIGHPILGDTKYGKNNAFSRLALHAVFLGFEHPRTRQPLEFSSDIPAEFTRAFSDIR
jgi:23S rRNA pseudouridine1911/1915/1917 synthase